MLTGGEPDRPIALVAFTEAGARTARRIQAGLDRAVLHGRRGRVAEPDLAFDDAMDHLRGLFAEGWTVVGVCAAAILIRAVAPLMQTKKIDAPLVALAEDGKHAVPLLGGHRGANRLAERIATILEGEAAITTAGDRRLGFALDDPPDGWTLKTFEAVKPLAAGLLAGEPVALRREAGPMGWPPDAAFSSPADKTVVISDRADPGAGPADVVLVPPCLTVGVGCERDLPPEPLIALVEKTLAEAGLDRHAVAALASVDLKADEPAMKALAAHFDIPLRLFDAPALEAETPRLANPSEVVFAEIGCHGVAEAAALALAGADAELVVEKRVGDRCTCAVARTDSVDVARGRGAGLLHVVGIGPGNAGWRTNEAVRALTRAEEVVGYQYYLDLAADLIAGKPAHQSDLGAEEARAAKALTLAAEGKEVALICSGDPGIYALATLVFELAEKSDSRAERAVDIHVVPGISAFQAASARLGAPMGHDFCLISLSDLLTPVAAIRKRLKAAAEGDFVTAFYNPQSKRRRTLLPEALETFRAHRPADAPVAICRQLGRPEERVEVTTFAEFDPETVDMFTLVIFGSSQSRAFDRAGRRWMFTPRGYADKAQPAREEISQ